jgi:hypothetical protein
MADGKEQHAAYLGQAQASLGTRGVECVHGQLARRFELVMEHNTGSIRSETALRHTLIEMTLYTVLYTYFCAAHI